LFVTPRCSDTKIVLEIYSSAWRPVLANRMADEACSVELRL